MLNHDKVISKERLFERVWGYCSEAEVSNVELYVHYLRKKLNTWRIRTVRRRRLLLAEWRRACFVGFMRSLFLSI